MLWRKALQFAAGGVAALLLGGCGVDSGPLQTAALSLPSRIVSLDYCADQFVLQFAPRERILALSPDATRGYSYLRDSAVGMPTVRPRAEDVLVLQPDLVVRQYGGGPGAADFLRRAGVPVLEVGWADTLDDVAANVERVAAGLGAQSEGRALTAQMRSRLASLPPASVQPTLYLTPGGVTSGPGSLLHELLLAAGLANFETRSGWRSLPLERLAYQQPALIAAAFFQSDGAAAGPWSPMRHPVAQAQLRERPVVPLAGAWTSCGGWFLLDAVEALAQAAAEIDT